MRVSEKSATGPSTIVELHIPLNIHAPDVFLDSMRRMSDPPEAASAAPSEDVPTAD